jgi:DNA-binding MarR family transcriptional regulator
MTRNEKPSDLTMHLGYWLRLVSNQVSHAFASKLSTQGVTVAEWVLLRGLFGKEHVAPSELADSLGMTRGAISKLSDRLTAKGLISRTAHQQDGRAHTLALSREGKALVPALAKLADINDQAFFSCLSPSERSTLLKLMQQIAVTHDIRAVPTD